MTESEIKKHLLVQDIDLELYQSVTSTNSILRQKAEQGAREKTIIIANEQTAGRGRRGRGFFSPSESGIYMSLLLRPDIEPEQSVLVTTCAAVAVSKAIEKIFSVQTGIKWVNDIYIADKKVCGILTESVINTNNGKSDYIILGIGVNLYPPKSGFPEEIRDIASSVLSNGQSDLDERCILAAEILNQFFKMYPLLSNKKIYNEYRKRLFILGKEVHVITLNEAYNAKVVDLDAQYRLCVDLENGEKRWLNSGEVSTKLS